jgi:haloalkane dehalogenase
MVHGNPSWSFLYRSLVLDLRDKFRCIVPDHLGCGLSDKPQNFDYSLENHIGNLGALLDHLAIKRARLIVHDWGGPIGLGAARRRDGFVDKLVVLNTAAFPSKRIPLRIAVCRLPWVGAGLVRGCNAFSGAAVHMAVAKKLSAVAREAYLWPHRSWDERIAVHCFVRDIPLGPGHRSFAEIEKIDAGLHRYAKNPVLILWGGRDWCFDRWFFREWTQRFPTAQALLLPDAGHWLLEDDAEAVCREVSAFL